MLKPGDKIDDGTLLCTIKTIYYQDGYDGHWKVEFEDTDGLYHDWDEERDGGFVMYNI